MARHLQRMLREAEIKAFAKLYDQHFAQIYRFVYRRLQDRDVAEDVTSTVFFNALRAFARYRPSQVPMSAWLYRIAMNAINDHFRSRRAVQSLEVVEIIADAHRSVDDTAVDNVEAACVWAAVDSLPPAQRLAMTLRFGSDMKLADIGAVMGRTEGAVKLLLHRGTRGVRSRLRVRLPVTSTHPTSGQACRVA
ncbi:MAG TPA: sigma-70 family RNA polymerase sigma factor [Candidatus Acidoferrales bacterium]|nr:sigma-70 family RNA polymerase sigma factor [Candidatus Acidoferrales bacterium]